MLETADTAPRNLPDELFELLYKEVDLSQEMLALLDQEKTALVAMDMTTLVELSRQKLKQLDRIRALDESLQKTSRQITDSTASTIKLSSLNEHASETERPRLESLRQQLLALREQILSKNIVNKRFAEDTRHYLNDAISLITTATAGQHPSYGKAKQGGKSYANQPTMISCEV
jgi:Mg2+ and Co2+ transporter CorA